MSSIGYCFGKAALWTAVIFLARSNRLSSNLGLSAENLEEALAIPAAFEESAFQMELYHHLLEPYRSYECMPRRIHVSQASNVDVVTDLVNWTVSFTLDHQNCRNAQPTVIFGHGLLKKHRATADSQRFNFSSTKDYPYYESDFIFHVPLSNLKAGNARYWYQIEVEEQPDLSTANVKKERKLRKGTRIVATTPILYFRTPPSPGNPTSIALVGDLGQTINSTKTMAHILDATNAISNRHPVSMVMIVGDMSYADSDPERWTHWLEL